MARAAGLTHVAGCTGATSERAVQADLGLPDHAMLDMGDFVGGMLKYLAKHPVSHVTIGGGIGKLTKLAQGAGDLHSNRSQVDFQALAQAVQRDDLRHANTALEAWQIAGQPMVDWVLDHSQRAAQRWVGAAGIKVHITLVDREGTILGRI